MRNHFFIKRREETNLPTHDEKRQKTLQKELDFLTFFPSVLGTKNGPETVPKSTKNLF